MTKQEILEKLNKAYSRNNDDYKETADIWCLEGICRNCRHWGYNNRKPMNDVGDSICLQLKRKTRACSHCKHFKQKIRWVIKNDSRNRQEF